MLVANAWRRDRVTCAVALDPPALSCCKLQCLRRSLLDPPGILHHAIPDDVCSEIRIAVSTREARPTQVSVCVTSLP
jgi:hypothetical protein